MSSPALWRRGPTSTIWTPEGAWEKTDTTIRESHEPGAVLEAVRQRAKIHFSAIGEESFNVSYTIDGQAIRTGVRAWVAPPQTDAATFRYAKFTAEGPSSGRMPNATD